jgi:pimeloyl-ACP methyl ester carboxylesterase
MTRRPRLSMLGRLALIALLGFSGAVARAQESTLARLVRSAEELQARAEGALRDLRAEMQPPELPTGLFLHSRSSEGMVERIPVIDAPALPGRVAVLVHGLDDPGDIWQDLVPALVDAGVTPVVFEYHNDRAAAGSAAMLGEALRDLRRKGVTDIDLVCHSMGGLLGRDVLTRAEFYAGEADGHADLPDVGRFIMLGTPNAGSALARLRAVTELREQLMRWAGDDSLHPRQLLGYLTDGLGEAGKDLLPGSAYLTELNARPAPAGVETTCVVGVLAPADVADLSWIQGAPILREIVGEEEAAALSRAIEDLRTNLGDGCVPESSARLEGVADTVRVEASHRGMVRRLGIEEAVRQAVGEPKHEVPPAIPVVLERLAGDGR